MSIIDIGIARKRQRAQNAHSKNILMTNKKMIRNRMDRIETQTEKAREDTKSKSWTDSECGRNILRQ